MKWGSSLLTMRILGYSWSIVMMQRQVRIHRLWGYRSPAGLIHPGRRIEAGHEEIEILTAGRGDFLVDGKPRICGPGAMLWFYEGEPIHVTSPREEPYECVVFDLITEASGGARVPRLTHWADPTEARRFVSEALARFHPEMPDLALFTEYHDARMRWEAAESERRRLASGEIASPALAKAEAWIEGHFHEALNVETIAREAGIGTAHLYELFRRRYNESPMKRVIRLRVQRARDLLTTTGLSVKEVGYASGFQDSVHFGRTFKTQTGYAPGVYRRIFGE